MKKIICLVLSALMLFTFCACKDKKSDKPKPNKETLLSVLNSEAPFITEKNTTVYLKDYKPFYKYEGETDFYETESAFSPRDYTYVDLDKDEKDELIIAESTGETYLILHQENGKIYGYSLYVRWFLDLKQDGSIIATSGASINDYRTISFDKNTYKTTIIAKDYFVAAEYDELTSTYMPDLDESTFEIDGKAVTYEEINEFTFEWAKRPDAEWIKYSNSDDSNVSLDNIRQQLSAKNKVCGVLYLGGFASIDDCKEYCKEFWFDDYPFLGDIKDKQFVEASAGMGYFAIVPTDPKSDVFVDTLFVDGNIHEDTRIRCYTATDNGEPIVIKCKFSDVVDDTLVTVTDSDGTKVEFWPSVFLADGSAMYITETPDLMIGLNKTTSSLGDAISNGADVDALTQPNPINDKVCIKDEKGNIILDSSCFNTVQMIYSDGLPNVLITIADNKEAQFASATAQYLGKTLSLCVDDEVVANPTVVSQITDGQVIISTPTTEEAIDIINKLKKQTHILGGV